MRLFFLLFPLLLAAKPLDLDLAGKRAILINADTGAVLFEKNADEKCHPASTTKIATAIYALYIHEDLEKVMTTSAEAVRSITPSAKKQSNYRSPPHWLESDGTHIGLKKGEEMSFYNLLHAILISSANDACNVVAQDLGGTIPRFIDGMNHHLKKLGCKSTSFNNPHGLTHPDHLTTARDLALMAQEGLKHPLFREIVAKAKYTCPETNLEYERYFLQSNRLLRNSAYFYPQAIGMKTGTTKAAGKNLVAAATENDRTLIGVFLGYDSAAELYTDAKDSFEAAFNEREMRRSLLPAGKQRLTHQIKGGSKRVTAFLPEPFFYDYYPAEEQKVKLLAHWSPQKLPIAKGECVGTLELVGERGVLKTAKLYAYEGISPTLWHRLIREKKALFALCLLPLLFLFFRPKRV